MATLTQKFLGMADVYKQTAGMSQIANIMEVLNTRAQDIFADFVMMECNNGTKHTHTIRSGLPSVAWGALYEGIPQSKSSTQQVDETTGFVRALSTVDKKLLDLAGPNAVQVRANESAPFIESMAQEIVSGLFYHNPSTNVRLPKGLGARYGVKATSGAGNQIIDAGGTGSDNTSVWFVTHGGDGLNMIYPQGSTAGIKQEDKGEQKAFDANGNPYFVVEELIEANVGFAIGDYRRVVRIANLDVSDLIAGTVDVYKFLRSAYSRGNGFRNVGSKITKDTDPGRTVIYANTTFMEALDGATTNAQKVFLTPMEVEGKEVLTYRGIPIRETEALLNTEARVV